MPALVKKNVFVDLAVAKPTGLNDLGVPIVEGTTVKKGKLAEFAQPADDGKAGRLFQNIRVTAIKTIEGELEASKVFVQFEIFGDDNAPVAVNLGFDGALYAGESKLLEFRQDTVFLPYARWWYENRYAYDIPNEVFDRFDRLEFIMGAEDVRRV